MTPTPASNPQTNNRVFPLLFVCGLLAGVGVMVAASVFQDNAQSQDSSVVGAESPAQVQPSSSPFAVKKEPSTEPSDPVVLSSNTESTVPEVAVLLQRIELAESRIEELETSLADVQFQQIHSTSEFLPNGLPNGQSGSQQTAQQDSQTNLLNAGFEPATVEEIQNIRNDLQLQRLELRDRATREGWVRTDRFRDEQRALRNGSLVRETLGDEDFDKFLLAEGRDNRVRIDSVIENSAADLAGIQVGDIVMRYADERIFGFRDLQQSTTEGERDQPVNIQISREGELLDFVIPRGPMGVTLSGVSSQ